MIIQIKMLKEYDFCGENINLQKRSLKATERFSNFLLLRQVVTLMKKYFYLNPKLSEFWPTNQMPLI